MKTKTDERRLLWWNVAIAAMTVIAWCIMAFWDHADALLEARGVDNLKFFTVLSNVFEGIVSLALAVRLLRVRRGRAEGIPHALYLLKLLAAVTVTVTFAVVAVFFGPWVGYRPLYRYANFFFHLVIPLAAITEFLFLDRFDRASFRETLWAPLPALVYGTVYTVNVVVNGPGEFPNANDFYGFTNWGWPAAFAIFAGILLLSWGAACFLRWGNARGRTKDE